MSACTCTAPRYHASALPCLTSVAHWRRASIPAPPLHSLVAHITCTTQHRRKLVQEHAHQQLQRTHTSMTKPGGATLHTHQHAHIAHTPARIFPFALQLHTAFERRSLSRVERACESCVMQGKAFRHAPIEACKSYTPVRAWGLTRSISIRRIGVCSVVAGGAVCFQSVEIQIAF